MKAKRTLSVDKIAPTFLYGDKILINSRKLLDNSRTPIHFENCKGVYFRFITDDNTTATLTKDFEKEGICLNSIFSCKFSYEIDVYDDEELNNRIRNTIKTKKGESVGANRLEIFTRDIKLIKSFKKKGGHTATHSVQEYTINDDTCCAIYQEDVGLYNNKNIEVLRKLKATKFLSKGNFIIDDKNINFNEEIDT